MGFRRIPQVTSPPDRFLQELILVVSSDLGGRERVGPWLTPLPFPFLRGKCPTPPAGAGWVVRVTAVSLYERKSLVEQSGPSDRAASSIC